MRVRYAGECSAVAALQKIVREAAHKGRELPFDLRWAAWDFGIRLKFDCRSATKGPYFVRESMLGVM